MQAKAKLDGIITLVDAKHIWEHIDSSQEAKEQIAFADVILLNKIDLVATEDIERLEARLHAMNAAAKIHRTKDAVVDLETVLNVGAFDLDRALYVDPSFMDPNATHVHDQSVTSVGNRHARRFERSKTQIRGSEACCASLAGYLSHEGRSLDRGFAAPLCFSRRSHAFRRAGGS